MPEVEYSYPLSHGQKRLWWLQQVMPNATAYNMTLILRFPLGVNEPSLRQALDTLTERHDVLRNAYVTDAAGEPQQMPIPEFRIPLVRLPEAEGGWQTVVARESARPFDLSLVPPIHAVLVPGNGDSVIFCLSLHHILTDGRSQRVIQGELLALYEAYSLGGQRVDMPKPARSYLDFVLEQGRLLKGERLKIGLDYWGDQLAGFEPVRVAPDLRQADLSNRTRAKVRCVLSAELTRDLQSYALQMRCATSSVLLAAFQSVLSVQTGQTDITLGTIFSGRGRDHFEDTVGFFVNTVAIRVDLSDSPTLAEHIKRTHEKVMGAYEYQDIPFDRVVARVQPVREPGRHAVFDILYVHHGEMPPDADYAEAVRRPSRVRWSAPTIRFDIELDTALVDERLHLSFGFCTALYQQDTIVGLAERFIAVLRAIVDDDRRQAAELSLISERELGLMSGWPKTEVVVDGDLLHERFANSAAKHPNGVALVHSDGEMSFAQLNARVNRLARALIARGAAPERVVAVAVSHNVDHVVGLLATLKAGAIFLALDVQQPAERLREILEDASPQLLVTDEAGANSLASIADSTPRLALEAVAEELFALSADDIIDSDRLSGLSDANGAYIIYTSGSSGRPKGVLVEHRNLANVCAHHLDELFGAAARSVGRARLRVALSAAWSFDASWQGPIALAGGHELHLIDEDTRRDPGLFAAYVGSWHIDVVDQTPTFAQELVEAGLVAVRETAPTLLILGGEAVSQGLWDDLRAAPWVQAYNCYGPSECTVDVMGCRLSDRDKPSIGRPIWNTRTYILDERQQPVPIGVRGEIYIGGAQVARGYVNRPELNAKRFLADPFGQPGSRMYRTGDMGRWCPDGTVDFLGRTDEQVKIRGFRIELGDIEAAFRRHPDVKQVAVLVVDDGGHSDRRLCAYVVAQGDAVLDLTRLRLATAALLPTYMMPTFVIQLRNLPLTRNGKLDRQALPAPSAQPVMPARALVSPLERTLCGLFSDALGVAVGADDNFFEFGGHSLLAARLVARMRSVLGMHVTVPDLFSAPTVAQLAAGLTGQRSLEVVLPMRSGGDRSPLFCLHPGIGLGWCYSGLVQHVDPRHPIYALQSRGILDPTALPGSLPELAADYVAEIRKIQPHGPYMLLGWSFGGLVAHQAATLLQSQQEDVGLLAVLDAYPASDRDLGRGSNRTSDLASVLLQGHEAGHVICTRLADEASVPEVADLVGRLNPTLRDLGVDVVQAICAVAERNLMMADTFTPERYEGEMLLFSSVDGSGDANAWAASVSGRITEIPVACGHYQMASPEHLAFIGHRLSRHLLSISGLDG